MKTTHQKKQLLVILMVVFVGFVGISMPYLVFPALFLNPAYSILPATTDASTRALLLGITLAAYPLGQFVGSPVLGSLSDRYGRKKLLAGSLVVAALCYLVTGLALEWHQVGLLMGARFAAGAMEGNIAIVRAMAVDMKSLSKHEALGKINAATSSAYLIGPLFGGVMADQSLFAHFTASTPFYCASALFLCLTCLAMWVLVEPTPALEQPPLTARFHLLSRLATLLADASLRFWLITSTTFTLAVDMFYEFGPVYLTSKWMLEPVDLLVYNTAVCLTLMVGNAWLPLFFAKRVPNHVTILCAMSAFAAILMGISLTQTALPMLLLFFLSGLAIGLVVTLITVEISDAVSDSVQGEVMGVQISLRVLGDALICLCGSLLLMVSPALILSAAALICMGAMTYYKMRSGANASRKSQAVR